MSEPSSSQIPARSGGYKLPSIDLANILQGGQSAFGPFQHIDSSKLNKPSGTSLAKRTTVYAMPAMYNGAPPDGDLIFRVIVALIHSGRSISKGNEEWQTWVATITGLSYSIFNRKMRADGIDLYKLVAFPKEFLDEVNTAYMATFEDAPNSPRFSIT